MTVHPQPLSVLVADWAVAEPDRDFLRDTDGDAVTYGEADLRILRAVTELRDLGVAAGDVVAVLLPSSVDAVLLWAAVSSMGAIEAPLNTAYRGEMLRRLLADAGARIVVTDASYAVDVLEVAPAAGVEHVVVVGDPPDVQAPGCELSVMVGIGLRAPAADRSTLPDLSAQDIACLMYTSGTTGHSKGVLVPWAQLHSTATGLLPELPDPSDGCYVPAPMFHVGGKGPVFLTALTGARAVLRAVFRTQLFWSEVVEYRCTVSFLGGAMANFLLDGPDPPADHGLRDVLMVPVIPRLEDFRSRFGVRVCTAYNMTEVSCPIVSGWVTVADGSCGTLRPGFECRIVDEHDRPMPDGEVGELVVRAEAPWVMFSGYLGRDEDTVTAWRNLWFHTGDAFRWEGGRYFFVDRLKDTIRRRGENISSVELEELVARQPDVAEAAAVGVASPWGEEDVLLFVRLVPDADVDAATLHKAWQDDLPRFMVPRYVEIVPDFPRTPNQKIVKAELRRRGVGPATWDSGHGTRAGSPNAP
jgi:crotonobetaine/carnitine-CoA ligase